MPASDPAARLRQGLKGLTFAALDEVQVERLLNFLDLLARWNRTFNLTAVRDPSEMVTRHLLDSLAILPWVGDGPLLDVGTGAGLPGVPLAIARPALSVTALDSAGKKIRFLNQVRRELGLDNLQPIQARLESYRPGKRFDTIVSRAFASLADFARAARHLAGGARLLAMKGRHPAEELDELPDGVAVVSVERLEVPGLQEARHLVIMSVNP